MPVSGSADAAGGGGTSGSQVGSAPTQDRSWGKEGGVGGGACGLGSEMTGITKGETRSGDVPRGFKLSGCSGRRPGSRSGRAGLVVRAPLRLPLNGGERVSLLAPEGKAWGEAEERDAGEKRLGLKSEAEGPVFRQLRGPLERRSAGDLGP